MPTPQLQISIAEQQLILHGGARPFSAPISSGKAGTGFQEGSGRTPTGRFCICSRHGINAPLLTTFRARIPTGTLPQAFLSHPDSTCDAILTRILCLEGLDPANANTRARYIYIHGTPHIRELGTPASHGCIRLSPQAMAELFDLVPLGTSVIIS